MNEMLGNRIKELRVARQFTQEYVADRIGVSRQKYAQIENGANSINLDILSKVSEIFDVTVRDITKVLDETPKDEYRNGAKNASTNKIFEMLDLFYANKYMYERLQKE